MEKAQHLTTLDFDLSSFTKKDLLNASLNTAFDMDLPIAIWRMPNQSEINLIISTEQAKNLEKIDFEELSEGFVCAPFKYGQTKAQFIEAHFTVSLDFDEAICNVNFESAQDSNKLNELKNKFRNFLEQKVVRPPYHVNPAPVDKQKTDYKSLVTLSVETILEGQLDKVVPARSKAIELAEEFNPIDLFMGLIESYQNAFVSFISLPNIGTWIGASPETLIEKARNEFKTVALAGTQRFDADKSIGETAWTQKEIEEQAMVSRFIIDCFKKIRLREFKETGPKTVKAGNLLHLKTTYQVDTKATNFPELATIMLGLLHPTSAVAGMPKEASLDFLEANEGLDRGFFSGFLGPVNIEEKSSLFVNLRCMQLLKNKALLYAGAGVTSDSNPEKEFQETEIKFNTLLNILNSSD